LLSAIAAVASVSETAKYTRHSGWASGAVKMPPVGSAAMTSCPRHHVDHLGHRPVATLHYRHVTMTCHWQRVTFGYERTDSELPWRAPGAGPDEIEALDLQVTGALPTELTGRYLRNGPNRSPARTAATGSRRRHDPRRSPEPGRAEWYRNRWVQTKRLEGAPYIRPDGTRDLAAGAANTSVIEHGGKIFALMETSFPTR